MRGQLGMRGKGWRKSGKKCDQGMRSVGERDRCGTFNHRKLPPRLQLTELTDLQMEVRIFFSLHWRARLTTNEAIGVHDWRPWRQCLIGKGKFFPLGSRTSVAPPS
jgi:hypothetical protein